ncbi:MAG: serine/threonine-protein kinase [Luteolibacter sp.]
MTHGLDMILYEAASALTDAEERRILLDHACHDDPALRKLIEEMLAMRDAAEGFFVSQAGSVTKESDEARDSTGEETIRTRIGRYQLIERIGAGGCGVVYLAEQLEPIRRKVALKIIRLGMDTENVIARFEMERQALGSMNHPAIARVLDGGATASGRPYFVMELVDGEKITDFCDTHRLGVRERLELFLEVCQAIHHAHQKGLIHRDIKPSNILVRMEDGRAFPKVIDFGIAKATSGGGLSDETFTVAEQFLGTPAYMSPEQAMGRTDLDTRSDIYSLGALLYELLTGTPPFDPARLKSVGLDEVRKVLGSEEPPKPSALLASMEEGRLREVARLRGCEPERLVSRVRGDLDWIVMMAIAKDRERRYETANGLIRDVERHLASEPVSAGPPGRRYRLRKLIERNRVTFAAGGLVFLALAAGFGTSTWLFLREKQARTEQERLRVEADHSRAIERMLRQRAESQGVIARAAVKFSYGDMEGAAALITIVSSDQIPPSLEAAKSFRAVGEWHVRHGRWNDAAHAFTGLTESLISVDPTDSDSVSSNLLNTAASLCYVGDEAGYEKFRRLAISRFGKTTHPVVAEQIVKSTLIRPAGEEVLAADRSLELVILKAHESRSGPVAGNPELRGWSYVALALLHFRCGDDEKAIEWCGRCLDSAAENSARTQTARIILAMAETRLGRVDEARLHLSKAEPIVRERLAGPLDDEHGGFWFDWVNAGVLLKEAEGSAGFGRSR